MLKLSLRKIKAADKKYFAKWWRDKDLLRLTSGVLKLISDKEVDEYFSAIYKNPPGFEFMVVLGTKTIGHISLVKRRGGWYETQIVIGKKQYWDKNYGTEAIQLLIKKAKKLSISKIYLEVRPDNIRAITTYEKCGFKKSGIKKYPENKYLPETLRMELKK